MTKSECQTVRTIGSPVVQSQTSPKTRARVSWVDVCKGIAIALVVALHYGVPSVIDHYCHYFHMAVFFFLSGLFADFERWNLQTVARRAKSLLVPYFCFAFASFIFWLPINWILVQEPEPTVRGFLESMLWLPTEPLQRMWGGVQWFLPALLLSSIISWGIDRLPNRWLKACVASACVVFASVLGTTFSTAIPWAILPGLSMVPVFLLGNTLRGARRLVEKQNNTSLSFISVMCFSITLLCNLYNGVVNVRTAELGNPLLFMLGAISGTLALCVFSILLDNVLERAVLARRYILMIGANTIVVLYFHRWLQGLVETMLEVLGFLPTNTLGKAVLNLAMMLLCFALCVPVIRFINERIPWVIGRKKG